MALKTQQYELSNWQGMDRWTPETECDPHFWYDLQNFECDQGGITAKRAGTSFVSSFSGTCNMIYDHQDQLQQLSRALIAANEELNVISDFNGGSQAVDATFSTSDARHYAVTDDVGITFIAHELGGPIKMLCYHDSAWIFQDANFVAPSTISVAAGGSTTDLSGSFSAAASYVDVYGNESPLGPESATISLSSNSLDISIDVSADPTVDYQKFYVLGPGMSEYQFSGTASNTSGTYSHTLTMAELMAGEVADWERVECPEGKYLTIYEDMLLVAGDANVPDTVWPSNRQYHRQWNDQFARCVSGDGQPIRGFGKSYDRVLVLKADSIFLCDGDHQDTFRTKTYNWVRGATCQSAITTAEDACVWWSDDGVYADNGSTPQEISRIILNYLRTLDWRNMVSVHKLLCADTYKYYRQLYLALRELADDIGPNDVLLIWNHLRNTWAKYVGNVPHSLGVVQNSDDYEWLYGGDVNGNIWQFNPPNQYSSKDDNISGSTASIACYAETPWMHLPKLKQMPDWERTRTVPRYLEIYASAQPAAGADVVSLNCGYYVDFDRDNCVSTFSVDFQGHDWPIVKPYKRSINYGGKVGTFNWVKWRFEHDVLDESIWLHKLVFGFKAKPSVD